MTLTTPCFPIPQSYFFPQSHLPIFSHSIPSHFHLPILPLSGVSVAFPFKVRRSMLDVRCSMFIFPSSHPILFQYFLLVSFLKTLHFQYFFSTFGRLFPRPQIYMVDLIPFYQGNENLRVQIATILGTRMNTDYQDNKSYKKPNICENLCPNWIALNTVLLGEGG